MAPAAASLGQGPSLSPTYQGFQRSHEAHPLGERFARSPRAPAPLPSLHPLDPEPPEVRI